MHNLIHIQIIHTLTHTHTHTHTYIYLNKNNSKKKKENSIFSMCRKTGIIQSIERMQNTNTGTG
jgi:hypothetical protein